MGGYGPIGIAGGDTGATLNLEKRLRIVMRYLGPGRQRLLDCGCGAGEYVLALASRHQVDAIGLEYSAEKVRQAHANAVLANRVFQANLEAIPFPADDFDLVLLNEVLEHVPDEMKVLAEIRRVLRQSGRLVIFSPNRWFPFESHGVVLKSSGKMLPPYVPFVPYVPISIGRRFFEYWARNYWHTELRALVTRAGFEIESKGYVWQTFENISGARPRWAGGVTRLLRTLSAALERTPFVRAFGVSQLLVARKA